MAKNIFNKNAFKIKTHTDNAIKYLDGGWAVDLTVEVWEMGDKKTEHAQIMRDCLGKMSITTL